MSIDQWSSMGAPQISLMGALSNLLKTRGSAVECIEVSSSPSPRDLSVGVIIRQPTMVDIDRIADNLNTVFNVTGGVSFVNALSRSGINMSAVLRATDPSYTTAVATPFSVIFAAPPSATSTAARPYLTGVDPMAPPNTPSASVCMVVEGVDLPIKYAAMLVLQTTVCSMIGCNQSTTTVTSVTSYDGPGALVNFTFYETNPAQRVAAFNAINVSDVCHRANTHGMAGGVASVQPRLAALPPSTTAPAADNTVVVGSVLGGVAVVGVGVGVGGYMYWRHRCALRAAAKYEGAGGVVLEGEHVTPKMWRGARRRLLL